jgi:CubicO group peptidase (beta-lactamase class C family)
LEELIPAQMKAADVPCASIAVIGEGRVLWGKAFGVKHVDLRHPASMGTVFEAASLSKPVVAYAVLTLCDRGLLPLDTPLSDFLPQPYIPNEPRLKLITARTVLSHASGLQHWIHDKGEKPAIHFEPGTRFSYSSLGYVYLQQAIVHLTGEPLEATIQRAVLDPLGMTHSSFAWRADYDIDAATGHDGDGKPVAKWKPADAFAPASLHTTPLDYARFMIAMMQPETQAIATRMLQRQITVNEAIAWGLGWGLDYGNGRSSAAFWHWGDNGAFKAFCIGYRENQSGAVIMTNGFNGLKLAAPVIHKVFGSDEAGRAIFNWLKAFYG